MATATVLSVTGNAFVVATDGSTRPLQANDVIQRGETIRTEAGARVELLLEDGQVIGMAPDQVLRLDETVAQGDALPDAAEAAVQQSTVAEVNEILQLLEEGADLTEELEAAAAGGGDGGGGGGTEFIRLLRVDEDTTGVEFEYAPLAQGELVSVDGLPGDEPPATEPPATEPPVTEPPVTEPPVTEPPVTEPPVTEPPVTEPPATEPPVTEPPVTEPPVTEPPVTEPPNREPQAQPATTSVSEEGLPGGNPDTTGVPTDTTNAKTVTGTLVISDPDGDPLAVTLSAPEGEFYSGGVEIEWFGAGSGELIGRAGGSDVIRVTINNAGEYAVELSGPLDHPVKGEGQEDILSLVFGVTVSDGELTTSTALTVMVEDDSPIIDANNITLEGLLGFGELDISFGGDGFGGLAMTNSGTVFGTVNGESVALTSNDQALSYRWDADAGKLVAETGDGSTVFYVLPNAEGGYQVELLDILDQAITTTETGFSWSGSSNGGGNVVKLPINGSDAEMVFTANDGNSVNYSTQGIGVGTGAKIDPGETLVLEIQDAGGNPLPISSFSFTADHLDNGEALRWTAYRADGSVAGTSDVAGIGNGSNANADQLISINLTDNFVRIEFQDISTGGSNGYRIENFSGKFIETSTELADVLVNVDVKATDFDGDWASDSFSITFTNDAIGQLIDKANGPE